MAKLTNVRLVNRQEQASLLNPERSEVRAVFRVNGDNWLIAEVEFDGGCADSTCFCDAPGTTQVDVDDARIDELMWGAPAPDGETDADIAAAVASLVANHRVE